MGFAKNYLLERDFVADILPKRSFFDWFAGFVDGEGTIGITRKSPQIKSRTYYPQYHCYFSLASTNKEILENVREQLGVGSISSFRSKKANQKDGYIFSLNKRDILIPLFEKLMPLLKIKYPQAVLAWKFLQSRKNYKYERGKCSYTTEEIKLYDEIRKLNRRGK